MSFLLLSALPPNVQWFEDTRRALDPASNLSHALAVIAEIHRTFTLPHANQQQVDETTTACKESHGESLEEPVGWFLFHGAMWLAARIIPLRSAVLSRPFTG